MRRFEKQVAVITGGAAGIGLATARRLGAEGARVALLDAAEEELSRTLQTLVAEGVECLGILGDAADPGSSEALVARALEEWDRVDVLVANAAARAFGPLLEAPDADWDRLMAVNIRGTAFACRAAADAMRACETRGSMVLVSSVHAVLGRAPGQPQMPIYDATKAALISLCRSLAVELAPDGIRVNAVCPGFTVTDFHLRQAQQAGRTEMDLWSTPSGLFGRPAKPDEIATAIAFLASGDASYVTATHLMVDGGAHAV